MGLLMVRLTATRTGEVCAGVTYEGKASKQASWLKADDQTRVSARQQIFLALGEEDTGNGGQGRRVERRKWRKSGKLKLVVGL